MFHLNCVFFHLAEQTVVAGPKAGSLVDLEEDAGVPVEGNKEVVHLEKQYNSTTTATVDTTRATLKQSSGRQKGGSAP